mmetsp:Transcript_103728/g.288770  ORF Transcript_103728/g.288770 Transcript_103728/m.288770 type:complete len:240 (+) Transcript_103728:715-1434(+)
MTAPAPPVQPPRTRAALGPAAMPAAPRRCPAGAARGATGGSPGAMHGPGGCSRVLHSLAGSQICLQLRGACMRRPCQPRASEHPGPAQPARGGHLGAGGAQPPHRRHRRWSRRQHAHSRLQSHRRPPRRSRGTCPAGQGRSALGRGRRWLPPRHPRQPPESPATCAAALVVPFWRKGCRQASAASTFATFTSTQPGARRSSPWSSGSAPAAPPRAAAPRRAPGSASAAAAGTAAACWCS